MAESFNHFAQIAEAFKPAISQVVRKTALDIQAQAASRAPVDTGFLRSSVYTVTSEGSSYHSGDHMLPEVGAPPDDQSAYAAVGAEYGVYVNYGTSHMSARPFWEPAIDAVRPGFESAVSAIQAKLEEAAQ